ncbi:hypothetical protein NLI96_g4565 [Meripilus lineatus]|uniref:Uncharacterized protein n=1 Tax=Meripilus lineatus TaxID=2056292 RepID=A0AAD5YHX1_9APHY|nr:hypothetical protein NLI96_g4565 [Physisporinus lineatus]
MRQLRCLRIAADPLSITLFIQQLELTPLTSVSIRCTYLRRSIEDADNDTDFLQLSCLLKWIRRYLRDLHKAGTDLHSLQIQEDPTGWEENAVFLRLWSSRFPPPPRQNLERCNMRPHFEIRLANTTEDTEDENYGEDGYGKHLRNYLWRIVRWFPLDKLRNLHINDSDMMEYPEKIYGAFPEVEVLTLSETVTELDMLLNALSSPEPKSRRCLLPALHTLVIHDTRHVHEREVLDLVDYRLKCERPLQNVHIIRCPAIKSTFIEQLRKKVPNVDWEIVEETNELEFLFKEETDLAYLRLRYGSSALWHFVPRISIRNKNSRLKEEEEEEEEEL